MKYNDKSGNELINAGGRAARPGEAAASHSHVAHETKTLSYRRDRRNDYGENDKPSRKNVPLAEARSHRQLRRGDKAELRDPDVAVERVPLRLRKPAWKKSPDISLRLHLRRQRWRRAAAETRRRGEPEPDRPDWFE